MKMLSRLLVAVFLACVLSVGVFAQLCENAANSEIRLTYEKKGTLAMQYIIDGKLDELKAYMQCKPDLNKQWGKGFTALRFAAELTSEARYAAELLKNGADPNIVDNDGISPLMKAAEEKQKTEIVKVLLENGASPFLKDSDGYDAYARAEGLGFPETAKLILNAADARKPESVGDLKERGLFYLNVSQPEKAIVDLTAAINLDKTQVGLFLGRGLSYRDAKKNDLAIADFNEAIKILPTSATLYFHRGVTYLISGNKPEADKDFAKAIQLDPKLAAEIEKERARITPDK